MRRLAPAVALLLAAPLALAGDVFDLTVTAPAARVGKAARATVRVTPRAGYHLKPAYPNRLRLKAPPGVTLRQDELTCDDGACSAEALSFPVGFTARSRGVKTITGTLKFGMCGDDGCRSETEPVVIQVTVR